MAIVGIGVDVVSIERWRALTARTPGLVAKVLTEREREVEAPERLAARFAAKEAVAKALGSPGGMAWHDVEILLGDNGRPLLEVRGTVAVVADALGVANWHVSLTHDGGTAVAMVVAESGETR